MKDLFDDNRRTFLELGSKTAMLTAFTSFGIGTNLFAGKDIVNWQGMLNDVKDRIKELFPLGIQLVIKDWEKKGDRNSVAIAYRIYSTYLDILILQGNYENVANLSKFELYNNIAKKLYRIDEIASTEPAWWYMAAVLNQDTKWKYMGGNSGFEEFKKKMHNSNPALSGFQAGIKYYFNSWNISWKQEEKRFNFKNKDRVESHFLMSIFRSADIYYNENEWNSLNKILSSRNLLTKSFSNDGRYNVELYKTFDIKQKEIIMRYTMEKLKKASYNQQLIAAWSSFFLVDHLKMYNKDEEEDMFYDTIEKPMVLFSRKKKEIRIRAYPGGPYYR